MPHPGGRPSSYTPELVSQAWDYINTCKDTRVEVNLPSKAGLAIKLGVHRDTLFTWAKEYVEFSDVMEALGAVQEERLLNKGLAGTYNTTIAKVLLTKHGYREGIDQTTNDKDLPTPLLNAIRNNNSNKEDSEPEEKD